MMRLKLRLTRIGVDAMSVLRSIGYLMTVIVAFVWLLVRGGRFVK